MQHRLLSACWLQKCPFDAIMIINLPKNLDKETTHRYGPNAFKLHRHVPAALQDRLWRSETSTEALPLQLLGAAVAQAVPDASCRSYAVART